MLVFGNAALVSVGDKSWCKELEARGLRSFITPLIIYLPDIPTLVASIVRPEVPRILFFKSSLP